VNRDDRFKKRPPQFLVSGQKKDLVGKRKKRDTGGGTGKCQEKMGGNGVMEVASHFF